jgi:hypothetical protein
MSDATIPPDVRDLVERRTAARHARDWAQADAIREQLAELGWQVEDDAGGSRLRPILATKTAAAPDARALPSRLDEPAQVAASLQILAEDDAEDVARFLAGLGAHPPEATWELVVVANAADQAVEAVLADRSAAEPSVLRVETRLGWADARTLGMRQSAGDVTILLDTSVEPTGDFVTPLLRAFDDPSVGVAGPWGVTSVDGRHFEDAPPGEVDAVLAYCLAIRRDALRAIGGFDPRFRYYRNADLDLCFAARNAGWRVVATDALPLARHEHRGYGALSPDERDRLSRRNFYRFLEHWGDRRDLLVLRQR